MKPWGALILIGLLAGGCLLFFPPDAPIPILRHEPTAPAPARLLFILLPGRGGGPGDFAEQGFVRTIQEKIPEAELAAVDAHAGYYISRTLLERLQQDVIEPARARGIERIWLLGVSRGALGSLLYAQMNPGSVDGVIALAPFLGDEEVIREITDAGGPARWRSAEPLDPEDWQRSLWRWLQGYWEADPDRPPLFLGCGTEDEFAPACRMLAGALPPGRIDLGPGDHGWEPWRRSLELFLEDVRALALDGRD